MKRTLVWTLFIVATLSLNLAAAENEVYGYKCSANKVAGAWGYSETGTIAISQPIATALGLPGPGYYSYASVGSYTLDRFGQLSGRRNASLGGVRLYASFTGSATVNPDCTGMVTLTFFNGDGSPAGTAEKYIVYVNGAKEAQMIITAAGGPAVLTTNAKKMSPGSGN